MSETIDDLRRQEENRQLADVFAELLCRTRNVNPASAPVLHKYIRLAVEALMERAEHDWCQAEPDDYRYTDHIII